MSARDYGHQDLRPLLIKKLIRRVFRLGSKSGPKIFPHEQHGVGRDAIFHGARKVCEVLREHGHEAYVVGGAVRDLLLGVRPTDYDVATSADPEEVHRLFRRSRVIGRRFKLVHVMFGDETVEVSTFRAGHAAETDEHGRVLRDNIYGTREDDAARRDFTVNALYYDPANETILDFHKGMKDLRSKTVRIIGDARSRYREDPVRMLRAARFAAKLDFSIDEQTRSPIRECAPLLENVPPARVFEEMLKLLLSGHAATSVRQLREEGLHHGLLPMLDVILEQPLGERFVMLALEQTDERVRTGKPVSPAFLFASLLWHEVLTAWSNAEKRGVKRIPALHDAMDSVIDMQIEKLAIPRRFTAIMKEIWSLQPRFEQRSGRRPFAVLGQERFRAGFDFLVVRAASGEVPQELADWWEKFQFADEDERGAMLLTAEPRERARRKRRRKKPAASPTEGEGDTEPDEA
jgi:poly(A) polymerase